MGEKREKKQKAKSIYHQHRPISKKSISKTLLVEVAWEVCNQVGGIYTVIRTKIPSIVEKWDGNYCLIGPYVDPSILTEFEQIESLDDPFAFTAMKMREMGFEVLYGRWLVVGSPKVVLLNPRSVFNRLDEIKNHLRDNHQIPTDNTDDLIDQVIAFGHLVKIFFSILSDRKISKHKIIAHFHEWMAGLAIPDIRREDMRISTVFTTHATLLGRYLAMNSPDFYEHLEHLDWQKEAKHFNIETQAHIERAAAHGSHVFTTVSDVTAKECKQLLGRDVDITLPNGINISRYEAMHQFQNLHKEYKDKINHFTMGHFFQSFPFDLNDTLYFFTSGRYEYKNKGFDLTLEALARLNGIMQREKINTTIVFFIVTKRPFHTISPKVFQSMAMMEELRKTCENIKEVVGNKLFYAAASNTDDQFPDISSFLGDYWKLRYRRTHQAWKSHDLAPVVTHTLENSGKDEILEFLRTANLVNNAHDRVKIVYHPDFISPSSPLFGMEYGQFVRGCNLGVFPSYYEPWGYTPLECIASGIPTITSDLAGFGDYVKKNVDSPSERGIYIVDRTNKNFDEAADQLTQQMLSYIKMNRRQRITQRNKVESSSVEFGWQNLSHYYARAYNLALQRGKR